MRLSQSRFAAILSVLGALLLAAVPAGAKDDDAPFWVSLRFDEVNMRVGPSGEYPIDWVYRRQGLPLQVIRTREGWYLVRDPDGTQGWIAASQLVRNRKALVIGEGPVVMREQPQATSALQWRAEPGVIGTLIECDAGWCHINVEGRKAWVQAARLWGDEQFAAED